MITKTELKELRAELKKRHDRLIYRHNTLSEINDQINKIKRLEIDSSIIESSIRQYIDYDCV